MAEPVQITVTVNPDGSVSGFRAIGAAGDAMGAKVVSAAEAATIALANQSKATLTGAAAVAALTAKWEEEQKAIAAATAAVEKNTAATEAATKSTQRSALVMSGSWVPTVRSASTAFMGMTNEQTKANVAGRLLEQTLGLQNRALNQVISRSSVLGPLMAAAFPIAIFATAVPMFARIAEEIAHGATELGGYTAEMQKAHEETVKASNEAFFNPKTLEIAHEHTEEVRKRVEFLNKSASAQLSFSDELSLAPTLEQKFIDLIFHRLVVQGASAKLQSDATKAQGELNDLVKLQGKLTEDLVNKQEDAARMVGLKGFAAIDEQQRQALKNAKDTLGDPNSIDPLVQRGYAAINDRFAKERTELRRQEATEAMKLQDQVTENALSGIAKIKQEEADHLRETLVEDMQKLGLSKAEVEATALYQAQIAGIHQHTQQEILASSVQAAYELASIQDKTRDTFLKDDDLIFAEQEEAVSKARAEYEKAPNPAAWEKYQAEIVLADAEAQKKLRASHQATADKDAADLAARTLEITKLKDDQINAQSAAALASLPPWQKVYQQIYDSENSALNKILKDQQTLRDKYAGDADVLAQIDATAGAERVRVYAEANERIRAENQHLTEQFGSELQSAFDDMTSGNIGKRILANMEKFFFQIVAQWILSMNIMKSAFGQLAGIALFGPGSTGANVFGGGGGSGPLSFVGSLLGGGSTSSSAPSGAAFQPGGIFSDPSAFAGASGLSSAIAGTGAAPGGGVLTSASNALTTSTMAEALGSVGTSSSGAASVATGAKTAGGLASFSAQGLAAAGTPLAAMLLGASGGKIGSIGGLLTGLLLTGKLGSLIQPLTLGAGGLQIAAVSGLAAALTGGLIGFGVGQNHGGVLGSLAGAGTGALAGLMVGGPVGALVGGVIGLLGGIFGGIFGGSKRKRQANALADNTLLPDITQISTGFDGFQIDSSSAIQQLEQLRADSQKQLSALQSQGKDIFNQKVNPAIEAAERHIRDTQVERDRRSSMQFGPPQFETGGMFSMRAGNAGLAVLHDGEVVVNSRASKKNLDALAAMNAGKTVRGITIHNMNITAAKLERSYIMSSEFQKDLLDALSRATVEGKW
jgi:hypothetical protein